MRTKQHGRMARVALISMSLAVAAIATPLTARAEADGFGTGNGHNLAYAAVAADEVINTYAPITADVAAGATSIMFGTPVGNVAAPLGDPNGFIAGDLVMIWRATGVPAAAAPSGNASRIDLAANGIANGRVGTFEFARVMTATATAITLTKPLLNAWAKDVTQIVRVPEFTTVDVPAGAGLAALPWQNAGTGFAGGILVFLASGDVTNAGTLNANARGFRGGGLDATLSDIHVSGCPDSDNTEANGYAAKGEGVASTEFGGDTHGGRGNRANGAGGGNCTENGGGGGGGFGAGGIGGTSIVGQARSGLGGVGLDYSLLTRLSLGGGGGAGEQKNGVGSAGGAGGGTIFIRAKSVLGAGVITANGEDAQNTGITVLNESDGAGGGGAGGNILIRAVGNVTCSAAQTKGGKGGDTTVVGIGAWGAGGGGGGGRVLIQAKSAMGCAVNVAAGPGGQSGVANQSGAVGTAGQTQPGPAGPFCFSNPATDLQCANPSPICDTTTGTCTGCTSPFGGNPPRPCTVATAPVCSPNGSCSPCDGDLGGKTAFECQLTTAPYCNLTGTMIGSCGKCTTNADCTAGHAGPACNPVIGACGTPCTDDSMCKAGAEWCAAGVCVPKTPNGEHVPTVSPIDGECTPAKGKRVCVSAVCEMDDDLCGLHNGSPCEGMDAECRSKICFPSDKLCGKPTGEPCVDPGECRSAECTKGVCTGCDDDTDCANGKVCDKPMKQCVPGCREVNGKSNCVAPKTCSAHDGTIGQCIDGGAGTGDGGIGNPADDSAGLIEGGGCACRTSVPISGSPVALAAAAVSALLVARRRQKRAASTDNDESNKDQG